PNPAANLLGRVYQHFDQAGVLTNSSFDFKGNLLVASRQLIAGYKDIPDWTAPYLTPFSSSFQYDALDRITQTILPRRKSSTGTNNTLARGYLVQGPLA